MVDLLGIPSLKVVCVSETLTTIDFDVELRQPPCCKDHPDTAASSNGSERPILAIADTPMRGKAVKLRQLRSQYSCPVCDRRVNARSPDIHPKQAKTHRLIRYVENAILRRPAADIADEIGITPKEIATISGPLHKRLQSFRFPTPDVVAMDAVHLTRTKVFQVVSDGRTGRILDVFRDGDSEAVAKRLGAIVDIRAVKVFVTDMGETNIAVARTFKGDAKPLHVADKWHVLEKCNVAVGLIVGDQIKRLNERGLTRYSKALRTLQPTLRGRRTPAERSDPKFVFDQPDLPRRWKGLSMVDAAHSARWQLLEFYKCDTRAAAAVALDEFRRRARVTSIAERMAECLGYVNNHERQILNYFDSLEHRPDGSVWAPTTSPAERLNSDLQDIWHRSRGFAGADTPDQFWMKAVFHAYRLDLDLIECAGCNNLVGPLGEQQVMNRASTLLPLPPVYCALCAERRRRPEPEPEAATDSELRAA